MYEIDAGVEEELRNKALGKLLALKPLAGSGSTSLHGYESAKRQADKSLKIYLRGLEGDLDYREIEEHDSRLSRWESLTGESFEDSYEECRAEISGMPTPMLVLSL